MSEPEQTPVVERFRAKGDPAYSDVTSDGPWVETYDEAVADGTKILGVRNWRSFWIEKRYFPPIPDSPPAGVGG